MANLIRNVLRQTTPALTRGIASTSHSTELELSRLMAVLRPPSTVRSGSIEHVSLRQDTLSHILSSQTQRPSEYKLPTLHSFNKKTILDPLVSQKEYQLPTMFDIVKEKVTPTHQTIVPKVDPNPLQRIIDQGAPSIEKRAAWLVKLRHKKMKKHQLKKFRARMLYKHRKMTVIKKKKKEAKLVAYTRGLLKDAKDLDVEKFAEDQIKLAKQGGWNVDVVKNFQESKTR